ncbi:hypothetical protein TeGR_g4279, partial [Tetraparma gracilis]
PLPPPPPPGGRNATFEERKTVSAIKAENLGYNDKPDYLAFKATINFIKKDKENGPWYTACPNPEEPCKARRKVTQTSDAMWQCEHCNKAYDKCIRRYIFSMTLIDDTSTVWATIFDDHAKDMLGKTADEMNVIYESGDQSQFNSPTSSAGAAASATTSAAPTFQPPDDDLQDPSTLILDRGTLLPQTPATKSSLSELDTPSPAGKMGRRANPLLAQAAAAAAKAANNAHLLSMMAGDNVPPRSTAATYARLSVASAFSAMDDSLVCCAADVAPGHRGHPSLGDPAAPAAGRLLVLRRHAAQALGRLEVGDEVAVYDALVVDGAFVNTTVVERVGGRGAGGAAGGAGEVI